MRVTEDEITLTREVFVRLYAHMYVQIAFLAISHGLTTFVEAYGGTVVYASRDFELYGLRAALCAFTVANRTDLFRHLALPVACRANSSLLDITKYGAHSLNNLAAPFARITRFEFIAWFSGSTMTVTARIFYGESKFCFGAKYCVFKANLYARLKVVSARLSLPVASARAATKEAAKYITQTKIAKVKVYILPAPFAAKSAKRIAPSSAAACSTHTSMTKLVVALTFALIFQYFVGFIYFFKLRLVTSLLVWMQLYRLPAKGLFNFIGAGIFAHA
jgi:hypothetical protein